MKTFTITGWLIAAVLAAILFFPFKCKDELPAEVDKVREVIRYVDSSEAVTSEIISVLTQSADSLKVQLINVSESKKQVSTELARTKQRNSELVKIIQDASVSRDTPAIVRHCDSLVTERTDLIALITEYEMFADSVVKIYNEQLVIKDSIIAKREEMYAVLRGHFNQVSSDYLITLTKRQRASAWNRWIKPSLATIAAGIVTHQLSK